MEGRSLTTRTLALSGIASTMAPHPMTTGALANAAGVNLQTIRFYEREGLLARPRRTARGYRQYDAEAVREVRFIKRAQDLGFSLKEVKELLHLRSAGSRRALAVRGAAESKLRDIDQKLRDLQAMRHALLALVESCIERGGPSCCPILDALEAEPPADQG